MVEFTFPYSQLESGAERSCNTFPQQCLRAYTCYLPDDIPGFGMEGMGICQDPTGKHHCSLRLWFKLPLFSQGLQQVTVRASGFFCVFIIPLVLQMRSFRTEKWNELTQAMKEWMPESKIKSRQAHEAINHR